MKGRMIQRHTEHSGWDGLFCLVVLGGSFSAGALCGFLLAAFGQTSAQLSDYLRAYFQMAGSTGGLELSLWSVVWDLVRWPLFVAAMRFTALGIVGIPAVMLVRGFLLSYAAATFSRLFGGGGAVAALAVFGITVLLAVPVLFVAAQDSFQAALARRTGAPTAQVQPENRLTALSVCVGLLVLAAALQRTVMPALLSAVCARFFS